MKLIRRGKYSGETHTFNQICRVGSFKKPKDRLFADEDISAPGADLSEYIAQFK